MGKGEIINYKHLKPNTKHQMLNVQCPMPYALCPMPHAPISNDMMFFSMQLNLSLALFFHNSLIYRWKNLQIY
ncbi:hypothetical protein FDUTEX481_08644 [Tolypothrix sp. PCC 7601]|nr:hypothetical protein FDUTEX481_08644 [Tolypothrix sp. PCC 7601]